MANETEFVNGLIVKAPNDKAPDYIKARLSIKREELIGWLQTRSDEWINADVKVSQGGKWYAAVDNWKPNSGDKPKPQESTPAPRAPIPAGDFADDDIPF